jgi:hypothetical protein
MVRRISRPARSSALPLPARKFRYISLNTGSQIEPVFTTQSAKQNRAENRRVKLRNMSLGQVTAYTGSNAIENPGTHDARDAASLPILRIGASGRSERKGRLLQLPAVRNLRTTLERSPARAVRPELRRAITAASPGHATLTFSPLGPFVPCPRSKVTACPSRS